MNANNMITYKYNGARSLVILHDDYLNSCFRTWLRAKELNLVLPETDDKDYESLDSLLRHIFRAARGYMTWMCAKLELQDPEIKKVPEVETISAEAKVYISHLLEKWKLPLSSVEEDKFHAPTYTARWGVDYCIDAMLEHAVMHPIRHEFQLKTLITEQTGESFK